MGEADLRDLRLPLPLGDRLYHSAQLINLRWLSMLRMHDRPTITSFDKSLTTFFLKVN